MAQVLLNIPSIASCGHEPFYRARYIVSEDKVRKRDMTHRKLTGHDEPHTTFNRFGMGVTSVH